MLTATTEEFSTKLDICIFIPQFYNIKIIVSFLSFFLSFFFLFLSFFLCVGLTKNWGKCIIKINKFGVYINNFISRKKFELEPGIELLKLNLVNGQRRKLYG